MTKVTQDVSPGATTAGQSIYEISTTQHYPLGERLQLSDGRVFHYCSNDATAIDRGTLIQGAVWKTTYTQLDPSGTAAAGASQFELTNGATNTWNHTEAATAYNLKTGFWLNDTDGSIRKITEFDDTAASAVGTIWIDVELTEALADADVCTVFPNPWSRCVKHPTQATGMPIGVPLVDVTASTLAGTTYYFWAQTWGIAPCMVDITTATPVIGDGICRDAAVAGAVQLCDTSGTDDAPQLGALLTSPVDGEFSLVLLMIHP